MCGILDEIVEAKGDKTKKPKSDKRYFRVWIRNVDRKGERIGFASLFQNK